MLKEEGDSIIPVTLRLGAVVACRRSRESAETGLKARACHASARVTAYPESLLKQQQHAIVVMTQTPQQQHPKKKQREQKLCRGWKKIKMKRPIKETMIRRLIDGEAKRCERITNTN